jgi:hypothetical protein
MNFNPLVDKFPALRETVEKWQMHACRCLKEFDKNTGNVSTNRRRGISRAV